MTTPGTSAPRREEDLQVLLLLELHDISQNVIESLKENFYMGTLNKTGFRPVSLTGQLVKCNHMLVNLKQHLFQLLG